jgi:hypothetical protein
MVNLRHGPIGSLPYPNVAKETESVKETLAGRVVRKTTISMVVGPCLGAWNIHIETC